MIPLPNISPLPFYPSLDKQNHRKDYAYGNVFPLIIHKGKILPFQFLVPKRERVSSVFLVDANSPKRLIDITITLNSRGLEKLPKGEYDLIRYKSITDIPEIRQEGSYYLVIKLDNNGEKNSELTYYSDIFVSKNDVSDCIKITYRNSDSLYLEVGDIDFSNNFHFEVYLQTELGKPKYEFEDEGTERNGYLFLEQQISKKSYQCTFTAPEYLLDALRIIRLCDDRVVECKGCLYKPITFNLSSTWLEQGDLASAIIEFGVDNIIASNMGYKPREVNENDFNKDYNEDFKRLIR